MPPMGAPPPRIGKSAGATLPVRKPPKKRKAPALKQPKTMPMGLINR